ncbi:hypothetical protein GGS21DRAFT_257197 [Xylaria nigripes]|nr:hypothetical protein GGS21DRAFT_257197 [Xylaria nigripes]
MLLNQPVLFPRSPICTAFFLSLASFPFFPSSFPFSFFFPLYRPAGIRPARRVPAIDYTQSWPLPWRTRGHYISLPSRPMLIPLQSTPSRPSLALPCSACRLSVHVLQPHHFKGRHARTIRTQREPPGCACWLRSPLGAIPILFRAAIMLYSIGLRAIASATSVPPASLLACFLCCLFSFLLFSRYKLPCWPACLLACAVC